MYMWGLLQKHCKQFMIFSKLLSWAKCVLGHWCAVNPNWPARQNHRGALTCLSSGLIPNQWQRTLWGAAPAALFVHLREWVHCAVCRQGGERPRFPWDRWGPWCAYFLSQAEQQNGDQEIKSPPLTLTCIHYATLQLALANHTMLKESNEINRLYPVTQ